MYTLHNITLEKSGVGAGGRIQISMTIPLHLKKKIVYLLVFRSRQKNENCFHHIILSSKQLSYHTALISKTLWQLFVLCFLNGLWVIPYICEK